MATFYNRTRVSSSIPRRLIHEGKWFLLPVYAVLRTSDLAREGIEHSGSWRFSDHVYRGRPSGRFVVGTAVDAAILALPSTRSFRERYRFVRRELERRVPSLMAAGKRPVTVVSVPCGIPRDLIEAGAVLRRCGELPAGAARFVGVDLDPAALTAARGLAERLGVGDAFDTIEADAFDRSRLPGPADIVTSTGFGEFLDDERLETFLRGCRDVLSPGGVLLITATARHRLSEFLLRELAELRAHYRTREELEALLRAAGFDDVAAAGDRRGLQTFAVARKAER